MNGTTHCVGVVAGATRAGRLSGDARLALEALLAARVWPAVDASA